ILRGDAEALVLKHDTVKLGYSVALAAHTFQVPRIADAVELMLAFEVGSKDHLTAEFVSENGVRHAAGQLVLSDSRVTRNLIVHQFLFFIIDPPLRLIRLTQRPVVERARIVYLL